MTGMQQEPVAPAETTEEMRAEITRQMAYDPLVRAVMYSADRRGLSGDDRYTVLDPLLRMPHDVAGQAAP
jgi:hypothetical protein